MPDKSNRRNRGPSFGRMNRQKNMKRVKALRDSGKLKRDNPLSKLHNSIKGALSSLGRKKDSSATRKIQGPKTKAMSKPTPKQAGEKLMTTFRKLTKVDNKAPISRQVIEEDDFNSTPRTYRLPRRESESYRPF